MCGMNVTLSIEDRVVAEARRIAAARGTSMNQLVRDFLNDLTGQQDVESVVAELKELWARESFRSEGPWSREELYDDARS